MTFKQLLEEMLPRVLLGGPTPESESNFDRECFAQRSAELSNKLARNVSQLHAAVALFVVLYLALIAFYVRDPLRGVPLFLALVTGTLQLLQHCFRQRKDINFIQATLLVMPLLKNDEDLIDALRSLKNELGKHPSGSKSHANKRKQ